MATDRPVAQPLLNPVLLLTKQPVPESPAVSGQGEAGIVQGRLTEQRALLAQQVEEIAAGVGDLNLHAGKFHVVASMFDDSLAPTWTPRGLFDARAGASLIGFARDGYLVELDASSLNNLLSLVRRGTSIEARTAISRVRSIRILGAADVLRGSTASRIWQDAEEAAGARAFILWLAPFRDPAAQASVIDTILGFEVSRTVIPTFSTLALPPADTAGDDEALPLSIGNELSALSRAARRYRSEGFARAYARVPDRSALDRILASGAVFRIDPARKFEVTSPSLGTEQTAPLPRFSSQPTVAVVDGGLTARSYFPFEVWRAPSLVPDRIADHSHGNRVASLVVHAHALNGNLSLPKIECTVGTVQAVPRHGSNYAGSHDTLIEYLRLVARRFPDAKVWNMSFNQTEPEDELNYISYLGHEVRSIAREFGILPIVSIGNRNASNPRHQLTPPADCEAALTVAGRKSSPAGLPSGACDVSLRGPGPDGMMKPDLSWFSTVKVVGGGHPVSGSSFAAPLVSSLAAHTFANLKNPTPDLVKALLIDKAELDRHDFGLGWGSPYHQVEPWLCEPGAVTMVWRSTLIPGYAYYWNDIPIPPELIRNGKLFGRAKLTAILNPRVSEIGGGNYFVTRLQVALQYLQANGDRGNLLGSMREDKAPELDARAELAKWNPVRRHHRDFRKRGGIGFSGLSMRLHARIFARDLFQFQVGSQRELGEQEVAFVLTFLGESNDSSIYNSTEHP